MFVTSNGIEIFCVTDGMEIYFPKNQRSTDSYS